MVIQRMGNRFGYLWLATAVFLLLFALALNSLTQKSPTFDEQGFIARGLGYVRGENRWMRVGHPLGLNALSTAFLAGDNQVALPVDDPSWQLPNFHRPSELFMWEVGNDVRHVMFLARLPTLFLGMLLTAVISRWAWEITGSRRAGLLALSLAAFDPNLIANMRLATTDLGLAAGATLAGYLLWRYWQKPSWSAAALAGAGFGLLQNTKFTAGLFVPLFALVIGVGLVTWWRENGHFGSAQYKRFPTNILLQLVIAYPLAAFLTLWAAYGFQIGTLPDNLPTFPQLGGLTLPLSHHLEQLLDIGGRMQKGTPSFLLGQYSDSGWWYYFPVAFLLKTPLPTLLLLAGAFIVYLRFMIDDWRFFRKSSIINHQSPFFLLLPALGYFAIALTTDINLGYRHILPVLPFLFVFTAVSLSHSPFIIHHAPFTILPILWLIGIALWIHPHFLAYFNVLAGGPDGGWRYLVDSNLDWGQDLGGLKNWMDENGVDQVWLSYFGEARPEYYGINYVGLDSYPPRLMNPGARPFYPHNPAPGIYAISATNLQGVQFADHDQFAWFRDKEPLAKIGYSIFIYDVPAYGEPVDLVLSGVQLDEIAPDDFARLGTNDVTPHWIDLTEGFLQPIRSPYWLAVSKDKVAHFFFGEWIANEEKVSETEEYLLYRVDFEYVEQENLQTFLQNDHQIDLVDFSIPDGSLNRSSLMVITRWQNQSPPVPIKLFIHLTDNEGNIQAQWDGLSALWEGFRQGDTLIQIQHFEIPDNLTPGSYQVRAGVYHPDTGKRWQTEGGDWVLLTKLVVEE